jgi:hypothetical protein
VIDLNAEDETNGQEDGDRGDHPVEITVDGETYTAPRKKMTPTEILQLAGLEPSANYLVRKHGREQTSYKDEPNKEITLHPREEFISVPIGDTTVS